MVPRSRLRKLEQARKQRTLRGSYAQTAGEHPSELYYAALDSLCRAHEDHNRELRDLPPLPRTEEQREQERLLEEDFIENVIPAYRESLGWQSEEAQQALDEWERQALE